MASRREKSPDKRMRKIALVICEGETEVGYLNLIKKWYKSPVRIVSHIEGTRITQALVDKHTRELKISSERHNYGRVSAETSTNEGNKFLEYCSCLFPNIYLCTENTNKDPLF